MNRATGVGNRKCDDDNDALSDGIHIFFQVGLGNDEEEKKTGKVCVGRSPKNTLVQCNGYQAMSKDNYCNGR